MTALHLSVATFNRRLCRGMILTWLAVRMVGCALIRTTASVSLHLASCGRYTMTLTEAQQDGWAPTVLCLSVHRVSTIRSVLIWQRHRVVSGAIGAQMGATVPHQTR